MTEQELDVKALEEAKRHMGDFAWLTTILGLAAAGFYFTLPFLVATGMVPFLVAATVMAVLTYLAYTALHEAAHGSVSGSHQGLRWINELVGYVSGLVLGVPLTAHRHEHLAHHRHTNDPEADPDFLLSDLTRSPLAAVRAAAKGIFQNYRYYLKHRWSLKNASQNRAFCLEILAILGVRVAIMLLTDPISALALFLIGGLGGTIILGFLFANLVHNPYRDVGRYVDTSTIVAAGPLNSVMTWLWLFQNYHSIHHLFPRVPFYRYRELFDAIEPIMLARGAPIYRLGLSGLERRTAAAASA